MQKFSLGLALCVSLTLTACVSESSYVGSDRQVGERSLDNSEAARTRISLGLNYLRRGDTTQAKYNLERAKAFAPDMPEVYNALAFYYQSVGEHVQAEEAYKQALNKDSNNADAYNNYGAFLCQIGKYDEAQELLLKAISRPGYIRVAESYENLALCQMDQQGYSQAKTFLESSIAHNGTRISSLINLAALNYAMGDNVGAKTALQRIQRLGRVSARSTLLNYLVAEKQGDVSTMQHAEQLLLTLYIDTPEARLLLQQNLLQSEFEQLREQYKLSLMANIVVPGSSASVTPTEPVANPRLKVVRRKSAEPTDTASAAGAMTEQAIATAGSVSSQQIAGVLTVSGSSADETSMAAETRQQAADKMIADKQVAEQQAADQAAARLLAEQEAALQDAARQEVARQEAAREEANRLAAAQLAAEQEAAGQLAAEQAILKQQADAQLALQTQGETEALKQDDSPATEPVAENIKPEATAASQQILAATPPAGLPEETVLTEAATAASEQASVVLETTDEISDETLNETANPADTSTMSAASQPVAETESDTSLPEFHTVQEGESLYAISVLHNIRLARLMEWNQLTPESVIKTGQQIWLAEVDDDKLQQQLTASRMPEFTEVADPAEPYHQVVAGETMFGISYRYNIRLERFMAWNSLTEQSKLRVGQQVLVIDPANIEP
tara:strand:+ start:224 stop:2248 length:2025 start_codon:yes stop_codon:yes gene_type:complete